MTDPTDSHSQNLASLFKPPHDLKTFERETAQAPRRKASRREEILQAGIEVLALDGWQGTSMTKIARRARASKETLYAWFGDKSGFFAELIELRAWRLDAAVSDVLQGELEAGLTAWGEAVLAQYVGPDSIALHRAAISEAGRSDLGGVLAFCGRGAAMPRLARWLEQHADAGHLTLPEGALEAAEDYLALLKGDAQLLCLLDAAGPLRPADIARRATRATKLFLRLYRSSV
jgi:AcrR family transcriptional regulator